MKTIDVYIKNKLTKYPYNQIKINFSASVDFYINE